MSAEYREQGSSCGSGVANYGAPGRVPSPRLFSKDHALQIRVDSYSNSARKVDIVQCGAQSGASD